MKKKQPNADGSENPNATPGEQEEGAEDKPEFVTAAQVAEIVNKAVTGHMKRLKVPTADEIVASVTAALEKKAEEKAAEEPPAGGKQQGSEQTAPEVVALRKELESIKKSQAASQAKAEALEKKQADEAEKSLILKTLEAGGVTGYQARALVNHFRAEGLVRKDGESLVFGDDADDLGAGISKFLATPEGKAFIPATGAGGSGSGPVNRGKGSGNEREKDLGVLDGFLRGG